MHKAIFAVQTRKQELIEERIFLYRKNRGKRKIKGIGKKIVSKYI